MSIPLSEVMSIFYLELASATVEYPRYLLYQMSEGQYVPGSGVKITYDTTLNQVLSAIQDDLKVDTIRHNPIMNGFRSPSYKRRQILDAYYQINTV